VISAPICRQRCPQATFARKHAYCSRCPKDYERYAETLAGFHVIAFVGYMLTHLAAMIASA